MLLKDVLYANTYSAFSLKIFYLVRFTNSSYVRLRVFGKSSMFLTNHDEGDFTTFISELDRPVRIYICL